MLIHTVANAGLEAPRMLLSALHSTQGFYAGKAIHGGTGGQLRPPFGRRIRGQLRSWPSLMIETCLGRSPRPCHGLANLTQGCFPAHRGGGLQVD